MNQRRIGGKLLIFSFIYLVVRALLRAFLPRTKFDMATEAELLVLRHELQILRPA